VGVVVRERGGTHFRQIFWSRNGAPATIVGHRWNANTEALRQITLYSLGWPSISLFSGLNSPKRGIWHQKSPKKISGGDTPGPPPAPTPSTATRRARGRKLPRCWDLGLGNRSPKSKYTTTPLTNTTTTTTTLLHHYYTWLLFTVVGVRKSIQAVKFEWWGVGVVICLEQGADCLHMVQLMPLPPSNPIISCLI